jgi:4-alpha-glucanotransferase
VTIDRARLEAFGIAPEYPDIYGQWHQVDEGTAQHLLRAMDVPPDADVPPASDAVIVVRAGETAPTAAGELVLESGDRCRVDGALPTDLPLGYHELRRDDGGTTRVIVSPGRCQPHPGRIWGWAVQVYAATSRASWGVGDLGDLTTFGRWASGEGAEVVLINPLDAAIPERPRATSPYYPSTRLARDLLYLRIEQVPGADLVAAELPALAASARRDDRRIDRDAVVDAKLRALELIWEASPTAGHEPELDAFLAELGPTVELIATFTVLAEQHGGGWRTWPEELHDPASSAVTAAAAAHADRIRFHCWIQWLLDEQLRVAGDAVPLMRDLPVGVDPDGADAWLWQDVFAKQITVGAPPDRLGPQGQDWQVPAFVPWKLREAAYEPFVLTLRSAFRHAAALRIDHVMGLFRLFWIPPSGPQDGAYVRQPVDDLLDILALESHRAGAYVVGEDLGTVEDGVREELASRGVLRYRVLWFEEEHPDDWAAPALGSVTTHDLPTVAGLWSGRDLEALRAVGAPADAAWQEKLRDHLAWRAGIGRDATPEGACEAAAWMLGRAGCDVVVAQLEDAVGADHRINVPGTDEERPDNWSLTLPVLLEDIPGHPLVERVVVGLHRR